MDINSENSEVEVEIIDDTNLDGTNDLQHSNQLQSATNSDGTNSYRIRRNRNHIFFPALPTVQVQKKRKFLLTVHVLPAVLVVLVEQMKQELAPAVCLHGMHGNRQLLP